MVMKEKQKRIRILADPQLSLMGLLYIVVMLGSSLFIMLTTILRGRNDELGVAILFGILAAAIILIAVFVSPQWFVWLEFLPTGIRIKPAWKKAVERPYKYYAYVNRAGYWHGTPVGIGKTVDYIVFSHRRLKDEELYAINRIASSEKVIKIQYTPKTYQRLMELLPTEMRYKLKVCGFE